MNFFLRGLSFLLIYSLLLCFGDDNIYLNYLNPEVYASELFQGRKQTKQTETKQNFNQQLLIAAQNGKIAEVRSLLAQATDVNVRDEYGWTPLLWAAMNGHTNIVRVLLVSGANPNTRNKYGWTPLMWASGQGYDDIVRSLIASGARLNAQDHNGWTAILWAWDGKQTETVAILRSATRKNRD